MATRFDAWPVLRALLACRECGGTGVNLDTEESETCERCMDSVDVGFPFRVDPDNLIYNGDCIPPEEKWDVIFDPETVYDLPT